MNKPYSLAVKAVILDADGRSLLIRRSPANNHFVGAWEWPGGKCDPGEPFEQAVLREVMEETSLRVEITGLAGATHFEMPKVHVVLLCMDARLVGGELKLSEEHDQFAWVAFSEYPRLEFPAQVQSFMREYAAKKAAKR